MKYGIQLWQRMGADIDAKKQARSQVRAYAKAHGITPARQQTPKPKRAKRSTPTAGACRSLSADEIRALGYETTKQPESIPARPEPKATRSIEDWQRTRTLSGDWC